MPNVRDGLRLLAAAVAIPGFGLALNVQGARADTVVGTIYQDSIARSCATLTRCILNFREVNFNLRVTSLSCRIVVNGTGYPDWVDGLSLKQTGGPEKVFVSPIYIVRYTETAVVYQVYISQPNLGIPSGKRPQVEIPLTTASNAAGAECTITGEVMPGA